MIDRKKMAGHAACFIAYAIFGVNIVTCKDLTGSHIISPISLFCIRSAGAGLIFWILSLLLPAEKVEKRDYLKIFAASISGFFITQMTFLMAIPEITPMDCSILSSMSPIYTMFIAAVAIHEPITWKKAGGVALSFCGIIYLIMTSATGAGGAVQTNIHGVILMIINGLSFAFYLGMFKPLIRKYSVVTFMKWIFAFSTAMSFPLSAKELINFDIHLMTPALCADLAILVIGATFISYFLIPFGQKHIRPTLVSMYSYVQPIVAIAISIAAGMDSLTWQKILAAMTVFGGVVLVSLSRSRD